MAELKATRIKLSDAEVTALKQMALDGGACRKLYEVINDALDKAASNPPNFLIQVPRANTQYRTLYHSRPTAVDRLQELFDCNQSQAIYTALRYSIDRCAANDAEAC